MRKVNRARARDEFKRAYGSRARQKFVNLMPCSACGVWGYSQNAHVLGNEGGSRKGHYTGIAPLCGPRPDHDGIYEGCHAFLHRDPAGFRAMFPTFNPAKAARQTERDFRRFQTGTLSALPGEHHSNG